MCVEKGVHLLDDGVVGGKALYKGTHDAEGGEGNLRAALLQKLDRAGEAVAAEA